MEEQERVFRRGRRIAVDVGDARIGVASCDPDGLIATPVETVPAGGRSQARLQQIVEEYDALEVVVGLPRSLSGKEEPAAAKVRGYAGGWRRCWRRCRCGWWTSG